ncbi:MAG: Fe-S cluster assembly protein SufD [Chitinophagaceae bacterium]
MANQVPLYDNLVHSFDSAALVAEPENVQQARKKGFECFRETGFPTRKHEEWKYTNLSAFLQDAYQVKPTGKKTIPAMLLKDADIQSLDSYKIVLLNGELQGVAEDLPAEVKIRSVGEARNEAAFAQYFGKNADVNGSPLTALNTALFAGGLFIEIAPKAQLDKPLHIVHAFTSNDSLFVQPRHLIVVHKSAAASIIESVVSEDTGNKIFVNTLTEVAVEENAHFDHYLVQTAQSGTRLVNQTEVSQKRDSVYNNYTFSLPKAELIRNNLHIVLGDEQTEAHLYGLYVGTGEQLIDNHSLVNHRMPNCNSNEIYKGVLADSATGVFNGKIFVHHDAQKTNAFQQNNNLLLTPKASINTKPQLEIFADDVKCSHGSTTGQLSKESMFYLQSRGIGEATARALLVNAFAFDVTSKIKIPALEQYINHLVTHHIPVHEAAENA